MKNIIYQGYYNDTKIQVIDKKNVRHLKFGNGRTQSSINIKLPYKLQLKYTRNMVKVLETNVNTNNILVLGLGAGSIPSYLHHHLPHSKIDVVEISTAVTFASYEYFHLPKDTRMNVIVEDALEYVKTTNNKYDLIFVDVYSPTGIPEQFRSEQFYQYIKNITNDKGYVVFNNWLSHNLYEQRHDIFNKIYDGVTEISTAHAGNHIVFCKVKK